jgi:exosome complex RNA-binding protein Rrp42 (RNase PH superfamily)
MIGNAGDYKSLPFRRLLCSLSCRIWYPSAQVVDEVSAHSDNAMEDDNDDAIKPLQLDSPVVIVDPDHHEEGLLKATVTVTYDATNPSAPVLCGVRTRSGSITPLIIAECMSLASKRAVEMAELLNNAHNTA